MDLGGVVAWPDQTREHQGARGRAERDRPRMEEGFDNYHHVSTNHQPPRQSKQGTRKGGMHAERGTLEEEGGNPVRSGRKARDLSPVTLAFLSSSCHCPLAPRAAQMHAAGLLVD